MGQKLMVIPHSCDFFMGYPWTYPDGKVHGANMGPTWGRQDPGEPHVGPMNFAIWECMEMMINCAAKMSTKASV